MQNSFLNIQQFAMHKDDLATNIYDKNLDFRVQAYKPELKRSKTKEITNFLKEMQTRFFTSTILIPYCCILSQLPWVSCAPRTNVVTLGTTLGVNFVRKEGIGKTLFIVCKRGKTLLFFFHL